MSDLNRLMKEFEVLARQIYRNHNEGPRLINEVVSREFPNPRRVLGENGQLAQVATKKGSED